MMARSVGCECSDASMCAMNRNASALIGAAVSARGRNGGTRSASCIAGTARSPRVVQHISVVEGKLTHSSVTAPQAVSSKGASETTRRHRYA